jgi:hypothetical protein
MVLGGLWHGANWTFVLWGLYHATLVFGHRVLAPRLPLPALAGFAITLPLAMLGWIPFRAETVSDAMAMFGRVLDPRAYGALGLRENVYLVAALLLVACLGAWLVRTRLSPWLGRRPLVVPALRTAALGVVLAGVFLYLRPVAQFIYFQF